MSPSKIVCPVGVFWCEWNNIGERSAGCYCRVRHSSLFFKSGFSLYSNLFTLPYLSHCFSPPLKQISHYATDSTAKLLYVEPSRKSAVNHAAGSFRRNRFSDPPIGGTVVSQVRVPLPHTRERRGERLSRRRRLAADSFAWSVEFAWRQRCCSWRGARWRTVR